MSARMGYQDIPVLGDSPTTNLTEEGRRMLIHALTSKALDLDFLNSPLQTLADVAAYGQEMNDAYRFALSEKENDPVGVPITAPVPLSYAVRGKTALQSILSMGEEQESGVSWDDPPTVQGSEQQIYAPISNTRFEERTAAFQPIHGFEVQSNNHVFGNPGYPAQPPMIIRPITPSTLMALTEPCLMAWCSKSALDQSFPPVNVSVAGFDEIEAINYMPPSAHNSWGY